LKQIEIRNCIRTADDRIWRCNNTAQYEQ